MVSLPPPRFTSRRWAPDGVRWPRMSPTLPPCAAFCPPCDPRRGEEDLMRNDSLVARWGTWNRTRWGCWLGYHHAHLGGWGGPQAAEPELPASMPRFTERGSLEPGVQWKATRPTAREGRLQLGPKRNQHPGKKPSTLSRPGASSRLRPLEGKTQAPGKASPSPNLGGPPVQGEPCLKRESGLATTCKLPHHSSLLPAGWPAIGFVHVAS